MSILLLMLSPLLSSAQAGPVFTAVGGESTIGMGGTWARLHAVDDGWAYFQVSGGDEWTEGLAEDLSGFEVNDRINLTNVTGLQDVQVERCPDGGWLVVGSWTESTHDDSAAAWRYDPAFALQWKLTLAEGDDTHRHNDMLIVCGQAAEGVLFDRAQGGGGADFYPVEGGVLGSAVNVDVSAEGGSWAERRSDGAYLVVDARGSEEAVRIHTFDPDWTPRDTVTVSTPGGTAWWPQRIQALDDGWLFTWLGGQPGAPFGDVWIGALDAELNLVDSAQLSDDAAHQDARPWLARKGDTVVVTFDRDVQPRVVTVSLTPGAGGGDDTGGGDGGGGGDGAADDSGAGGGSGKGGCGCATGGTPSGGLWGLAGLLGLVAVRRRRRAAGGRGADRQVPPAEP